MISVKDYYDAQYRQENYFRQREGLFSPYIAGLISFAGLKPGAFVLDVGCGQGLLSHLFHKHGMRVHGIDISETAVRVAGDRYRASGITFEATDITTASFPWKFDCIFVRSCSLYNNEDFPGGSEWTVSLLRHLKPDGVLIFAYNSNFSSKSHAGFRCHSLDDVARHFHTLQGGKIFFCTKVDTLVLGQYAFSTFITRVNVALSKLFGMGGDLVCIVRNRAAAGDLVLAHIS